MREKNIRRAARGLYFSQGDDKNKLLATRIIDEDARQLVEDQGRALVILEKLLLPQGKFDYSADEMNFLIKENLVKKGHKIQGDKEEDTPQYAEESKIAREVRLARVPTVLGMSLNDPPVEKEKVVEELTFEEKLEVLAPNLKENNSNQDQYPEQIEEVNELFEQNLNDLWEEAFERGVRLGVEIGFSLTSKS